MSFLNRFGVFPTLILGLVLMAVGGLIIVTLMNNTWLVSPNTPGFDDFKRAAADGVLDSTALYEASEGSLISVFLAGFLLVGTGFTLPSAFLINRRLRAMGGFEPAGFGVLLRQGIWVGTWFAVCIWLQMLRTLTLPVALLILTVFALIEAFIIVRRRSAETLAEAGS